MQADVAALEAQFEAIIRIGDDLMESLKTSSSSYGTGYISQVDGLLNEYDDAKNHFHRLGSEAKFIIPLRHLTLRDNPDRDDYLGLIVQIKSQSVKALGALSSLHKRLSPQEVDKLNSLRQELEKVSQGIVNDIYPKNMNSAIDEYEGGHYLASALISSRVVRYLLDQIEGDDINQKLTKMRQLGLIGKERTDVEQSIIKANNKSRNFLSHDIRLFAEPSDALALLGDAIRILQITAKTLQ